MKKYFVTAAVSIVIIFVLSNMSYQQQSIIPLLETYLANKPFEETLRPIKFTYWEQIISIDTRGYFHFMEFLFRKSAHFLGYGFVGVIFYGVYRHLRWQVPAIFASLTVFIIACLDEYRQSLSPDRTGIFQDVLLDTAGAIFCISIFASFLLLLRGTTKVKMKSKNHKNGIY